MSDTGSGRSSPVPPVLSGFPAPIGLVDAGLEQDMLRQQVQQLQQQKQQDDTRLAAMEEALRRIQDDGKRYIQQRDAELDAAKHAAQAAITAAVGAAAGRLPEDGVDKVVGKAPTSMEINAMVKNGNGNGRGRSRGRSQKQRPRWSRMPSAPRRRSP
uniref:Uncharacterized protein n=1 Tax=Eutreptiella gymnastica TaxID=73025 RepID=A0A7S1JCK6_9EUGL|mmetsp:Transcript_83746/g.147503  ORF Transcript_83746/g.147503 Transcript_83746/m.147503 type:complete len:157 (+) Transcript_83746:157-627(+)